MDARTSPRAWFDAAADAVVDVVAAVPDDAWDRPGLGEWTVRALVAHVSRAWTTVRDYLAEREPSGDALVAATSDERLVETRFGALRFDEYLRTRAFELTVHGLDLTRALGRPAPPALVDAAVPALALLAEAAAERGSSVALLEALAGRRPLPDGYTLLS